MSKKIFNKIGLLGILCHKGSGAGLDCLVMQGLDGEHGEHRHDDGKQHGKHADNNGRGAPAAAAIGAYAEDDGNDAEQRGDAAADHAYVDGKRQSESKADKAKNHAEYGMAGFYNVFFHFYPPKTF